MTNKQPLNWEEKFNKLELELFGLFLARFAQGERDFILRDLEKLKAFIRTVREEAIEQGKKEWVKRYGQGAGWKSECLEKCIKANYKNIEIAFAVDYAFAKGREETMEKVITMIENIDDSGGGSGRRIKAQLLNSLNHKN